MTDICGPRRLASRLKGCLAALLAVTSAMASAEQVTPLEAVQVTVTRVAEEAGDVPADITVISGTELRARSARDLRTVLSLVSGVEAPPGGDTGPAGAVPSFLGLHEFDAFPLVVDGIPWGGAFNPSIPTLDLDNVERVEVLKVSSCAAVSGAFRMTRTVATCESSNHHRGGQRPEPRRDPFSSAAIISISGCTFVLPSRRLAIRARLSRVVFSIQASLPSANARGRHRLASG